MFTQCPKCETVFRLSAEVLRAAAGQVRCGKCGDVFNALSRLSEEPASFTIGESPLELETRADYILESDPPTAIAAADGSAAGEADPRDSLDAPDADIAELEVQDWDDEPEAEGVAGVALEFTPPAEDLKRPSVERRARWARAAAQPQAASARSVEAESPSGTAARIAPIEELQIGAPSDKTRFAAPWIGAAILLALGLAVQVAHQNREWLASRESVGSIVRTVYAKIGAPIPAPANLAAYQLRQWGVTGDPGAQGTLHVRASILNGAAEFQPYPLLRVTLANRFGVRIGARDFEPSEYLGKPTVRLLAPGERADINLGILDPGKMAEGFEIDVCLRGTNRRLTCANDASGASRP